MREKMVDVLSVVMDPYDIPTLQMPISMGRGLYADELGYSFHTYFLSPDYYQGGPHTPYERYYRDIPPNTIGNLHTSINFKKHRPSQGEPVLTLDYYPERAAKYRTEGKKPNQYRPILSEPFPQKLELGPVESAEVSLKIVIDQNAIPTLFSPGVREAIRMTEYALMTDEEVNHSDIPARYKVFEEMQKLIGRFLKLPRNVKMLPHLNLEGFKLFGNLPNGNKFYAEINPWLDPRNALGVRIKFGPPDSWIWKENMEEASYEFAAEDSIKRMDRINKGREEKGLSPLLATDDLNQVRQELGF